MLTFFSLFCCLAKEHPLSPKEKEPGDHEEHEKFILE